MLTALLSALVNLNVAVVVAMPVALRTRLRRGLSADRLAVAVAMMANAASFLLPTSNITNLLLLGRMPLATAAYLSDSWLPWSPRSPPGRWPGGPQTPNRGRPVPPPPDPPPAPCLTWCRCS